MSNKSEENEKIRSTADNSTTIPSRGARAAAEPQPNVIEVTISGMENFLNQKNQGAPVLFTDNDSKKMSFDDNNLATVTQKKERSLGAITVSATQVLPEKQSDNAFKYGDEIKVKIDIKKSDPHVVQAFMDEVKKISRDQPGAKVTINKCPAQLRLKLHTEVKQSGLAGVQRKKKAGPVGWAARGAAKQAERRAEAKADKKEVALPRSTGRK